MTLEEYLDEKKYSSVFIDKYLVPMGAAIWSSSTSAIKQFSFTFFIRFFKNHGLLSVNNRPQWHVVKGGSASYLAPLINTFKDNIFLNSPVKSIERYGIEEGGSDAKWKVKVRLSSGVEDEFDHVIVACHSDQALSLLIDADVAEKEILGAIKYKSNEVVLHTDESLLPKRKKAWASWNYKIMHSDHPDAAPVLTYNMNILQQLNAPCTFCVTLNATDSIASDKILGTYHYSHPAFSIETVAAQKRWADINGKKNTWFCGAYWANGFHEDGIKSAVRIAEKFGITL